MSRVPSKSVLDVHSCGPWNYLRLQHQEVCWLVFHWNVELKTKHVGLCSFAFLLCLLCISMHIGLSKFCLLWFWWCGWSEKMSQQVMDHQEQWNQFVSFHEYILSSVLDFTCLQQTVGDSVLRTRHWSYSQRGLQNSIDRHQSVCSGLFICIVSSIRKLF